MRRAARHPVDYSAIGEHRTRGDIMLHVANLSATGFMVAPDPGLGKGERVTIRLPRIGRIEAFLIWSDGQRAGFQFERVLRLEDFLKMIDALQPNPRLRKPR